MKSVFTKKFPEERGRVHFISQNAALPFTDRQLKEGLDLHCGRLNLNEIQEDFVDNKVFSSAYSKFKRIMDYFGVVLLFILFAPVILAVAVIIKLADEEPVLFKQIRVGINNRDYTVYKFRSMSLGKKITKFGRFIRRTKIDELPQLYNVLMGDMSLIGPRPEQRPLVDCYSKEIPYYAYRHIVKPGITGWAQVEHGYVDTIEGTRVKLEYDLYYLKNLSFRLEVLIVSKTLFILLKGFFGR